MVLLGYFTHRKHANSFTSDVLRYGERVLDWRPIVLSLTLNLGPYHLRVHVQTSDGVGRVEDSLLLWVGTPGVFLSRFLGKDHRVRSGSREGRDLFLSYGRQGVPHRPTV